MKTDSRYGEVGTAASAYAEDGPYHCEGCVHVKRVLRGSEPGEGVCTHPMVMLDPQMRKYRHGMGALVKLEKGCCKFVRYDSH